MKLLNFILDWIWQFPQTLVGKLSSLSWKNNFKRSLTIEEESLLGVLEGKYKVKIYYVCNEKKGQHWFWSFISAFSSGKRIKVTDLHDRVVINHEKGHSVFSLILGPLYGFIIGVPSTICNLINRYLHTDERGWSAYDRHYWYYKKLIWEWLADWAGGVDRRAVLMGMPRPANARFPDMSIQ